MVDGMFTYPHTIDNGIGERLTFLRRVTTPAGETLEVENSVAPGMGPPMHVHYFQEEALTVMQGRIGYQTRGREPQFAGVGETVVFRPGDAHRFWNAGEEELRCSGYVRPPDNIEYFLRAVFEAQKRGGGHRPDPFDAAYLAWRYRSEFGMEAVPVFIRSVVFPIQVFVGHLLGKYRKFADAPEPVRRNR
jgi:quercetin dioxygenase-like cupin family protein